MKYKITLNDDVSLIIDAEKEVDAVRRAKEIKSKMGLGKAADSAIADSALSDLVSKVKSQFSVKACHVKSRGPMQEVQIELNEPNDVLVQKVVRYVEGHFRSLGYKDETRDPFAEKTYSVSNSTWDKYLIVATLYERGRKRGDSVDVPNDSETSEISDDEQMGSVRGYKIFNNPDGDGVYVRKSSGTPKHYFKSWKEAHEAVVSGKVNDSIIDAVWHSQKDYSLARALIAEAKRSGHNLSEKDALELVEQMGIESTSDIPKAVRNMTWDDSAPDELTDAFERRDFGDVRVVERSGEVQIGWAALGTVSVSEAEKFSRDLQKAIDYAKSHK